MNSALFALVYFSPKMHVAFLARTLGVQPARQRKHNLCSFNLFDQYFRTSVAYFSEYRFRNFVGVRLYGVSWFRHF